MSEAEPDTLFETCWTNYMPAFAAARIGKVHLTTRESYPRTLCGRLIEKPSKRFFPRPNDPRCTTCAKKVSA